MEANAKEPLRPSEVCMCVSELLCLRVCVSVYERVCEGMCVFACVPAVCLSITFFC